MLCFQMADDMIMWHILGPIYDIIAPVLKQFNVPIDRWIANRTNSFLLRSMSKQLYEKIS